MRRIAAGSLVALAGLLPLGAAGCRRGGIPVLNLLGLGKPLVVALVMPPRLGGAGSPLELLNPFGPYEPLRQALGEHVGRSVALDLCLPVQVRPNLAQGFYDVAICSAAEYARLGAPAGFSVIAVPTDERGRVARPALLVVARESPVRTVADLRGRKVAFGPAGDARTHRAALELLRRHGLKPTDLSLEILPLPGSLKHFSNMRSVAQSVISGSCAAGFIDQAAWEAFPEHQQRQGQPARDKLRTVARTIAVPDRLVICSPKLDAGLADKVRDFLLAAGKQHPEVLRPLGISGYQRPDERLLEECRRLSETAQ